MWKNSDVDDYYYYCVTQSGYERDGTRGMCHVQVRQTAIVHTYAYTHIITDNIYIIIHNNDNAWFVIGC